MSFASLRTLLISAAVLTAFVAGCDGDDSTGSGGTAGSGGSGAAGGAGGAGGGTGGTGGSPGVVLDTPDKIKTYLDGKTLTMEGDAIPSHPNGYDENANFGSYTQCYSKTTISIMAGTWNVTSDLGTLNDAPNMGDIGMCDHATVSGMAMFSSSTVNLENVTAECFDITVTYPSFSQEGRGSFSADGGTLSLELYFGNQAAGHRCADGAVGDKTVKIMGADFTGDAVQVYTVK